MSYKYYYYFYKGKPIAKPVDGNLIINAPNLESAWYAYVDVAMEMLKFKIKNEEILLVKFCNGQCTIFSVKDSEPCIYTIEIDNSFPNVRNNFYMQLKKLFKTIKLKEYRNDSEIYFYATSGEHIYDTFNFGLYVLDDDYFKLIINEPIFTFNHPGPYYYDIVVNANAIYSCTWLRNLFLQASDKKDFSWLYNNCLKHMNRKERKLLNLKEK